MTRKNCGFSLIEIVVVLSLISTFSIILFKQYWSILQYAQQVRLRSIALMELDNFTEYWMTNNSSYLVSDPFKIQWINNETIKISWTVPKNVLGSKREESIQRTYIGRI